LVSLPSKPCQPSHAQPAQPAYKDIPGWEHGWSQKKEKEKKGPKSQNHCFKMLKHVFSIKNLVIT
jgi:hypothetical protein